MVAKERTTLILVYNRKSVQNCALFLFMCLWCTHMQFSPEARRLSDCQSGVELQTLVTHPEQYPFILGPVRVSVGIWWWEEGFLIFYDCGPPIVRIISGGMQVDRRTTSLQFVFVCGFQGDISTTLWCSVGNRSMTGKMKSILILFLRHKSFIYSIVF